MVENRGCGGWEDAPCAMERRSILASDQECGIDIS